MTKIALYMHGGSGNHGCEALARTISGMLPKNSDIRLFSYRSDEDEKYIGKDELQSVPCGVVPPKTTLAGFVSAFRMKFFHQSFAYVKPAFASLFRFADNNTIAISIGGDNYCYDGKPELMAQINNRLKKCGAKTVLFGCSIEPSLLNDPNIMKDLSNYDLIIARESITFEALIKAGVKTEIIFGADPAFTMEPEYRSVKMKDNTVGINISPMVLSCGSEQLFDAYMALIDSILTTTDLNVMLVPHVVWHSNDDRKPIAEIYKKFETNERVTVLNDAPAPVLKGYISKCRFFIGARTHSTIAAYSTGVPTIVIGYSVKSRGIARDLFGTEEHYVVNADTITSNSLENAFKWVYNNEERIQERLKEVMPEYKKTATMPARRITEKWF